MPSLISLERFKAIEQTGSCSSTNLDTGELLEFQHLELRVHPPNVEFNNTLYPDRTVITVDSANRPGTLVELVQWLTEMGLDVRKARISSDGGWFVDEFHTDRITDKMKEIEIRRVLGAEPAPLTHSLEETVFELAGQDRPGLLADVINLLQNQGCDVQSAALWTSHGRAAFVISVHDRSSSIGSSACGLHSCTVSRLGLTDTEQCARVGSTRQTQRSKQGSGVLQDVGGTVRGGAGLSYASKTQVHDLSKLQRLQDMLSRLLADCPQADEPQPERLPQDTPTPRPADEPEAFVQYSIVRGGPIHFERRLHRLLLMREQVDWMDSDQKAVYEALVGDGHGELPAWKRPPPLVMPPTPSASAPSDFLDKAVAALFPASMLSGWSYSAGPADAQQQPYHNPVPSAASAPRPHRLSISSGQREEHTGHNGYHGGASNRQHLAGSTAAHLQLPPPSPTAGKGSGRQSCSGLPSITPASCPAGPLLVSPKFSKPEVSIRYNARLKYWLVEIRCKDRKKLFFDTVCTLADLEYDIFHASVDVEEELAHQVYYIRRCTGDSCWDRGQAAKLWYLLEASIQRRFPKGQKIRIQSWQEYDLAALTAAWRDAGLLITRAKVRPSVGQGLSAVRGVSNTFYLLDSKTLSAPDPEVVQEACLGQGGVAILPLPTAAATQPNSHASPRRSAAGTMAPPSPATRSSMSHTGIAPFLGGAPPSALGPKAHALQTHSVAGAQAQQTLANSFDLTGQRCQKAAFGFALLQRTHVGSPNSMASSM